MPSYQTPSTVGTRIEQALAFGRSLEWIVDHLHVTPADVDKALKRIDAAHATPDNDNAHHPSRAPALGCGTHAGYVRHRDRNEKPCRHCSEGQRQYDRARTDRRREQRREYDRRRKQSAA